MNCTIRPSSVFIHLILWSVVYIVILTTVRDKRYFFQEYAHRKCAPKKHISFLKTHKCASSTVQNIFLRYGGENNLAFAFPNNSNYLGSPKLFEAKMVPSWLTPPGGRVDIFCLHTRLNVKEMKKILHEDTIWVTIVRNPVELFESLYAYYKLEEIYKTALDDISLVPVDVLRKYPRALRKYGINSMLFDFGFSPTLTLEEVQQAIQTVDQQFHLVMIAEKMDESLILLRDLLCWQNEEIAHFVKNARPKTSKKELSLQTKATIEKLNKEDQMLYDHFLKKHQRKVEEYGTAKMSKEVEEFRAYNEKIFNKCSANIVNSRKASGMYKDFSPLVDSYVVKENSETNCKLLAIAESHLIDILREKQKDDLSIQNSVIKGYKETTFQKGKQNMSNSHQQVQRTRATVNEEKDHQKKQEYDHLHTLKFYGKKVIDQVRLKLG